jgi:hypothetical protein
MQERPLHIKGQFLEDSAKIGQPIHYSLQVVHDKNQELFFPGIQRQYGVFEPVKKEYFKTKSTADGNLDSAVYTFRFFDIADYQSLSLPIYLLQGSDCTQVFPKPDTIFLQRLVPHPEKINMEQVFQQVAIPTLSPKTDLKNVFIYGISIFILSGLIYWVFGKQFIRWYQLYRLWRKNLDFRRSYQRLSRSISSEPKGLQNLEKAISVWKSYLENLIHVPFSTYTTKEMVDNLRDKRLVKALQAIDSAIYGGNFSEKTMDSVKFLTEIAHGVYQKEREKISSETRKK